MCHHHWFPHKNSSHFLMPLLVSQRNDVWEMSAEPLCWWHVPTQSWVVLLIGWNKFLTNQTHYPDLGSANVISMEFLLSFLRCHFAGTPVIMKWPLFSQLNNFLFRRHTPLRTFIWDFWNKVNTNIYFGLLEYGQDQCSR